MKSIILNELLKPLIGRAGTALAAYLIGRWSVEPSAATHLVEALTALGLVSLDLFNSYVSRAKRDAKVEAAARRETP